VTAGSRPTPGGQSPLADRVKWILGQSAAPIGVYALTDLLTPETGRKHFPNSIYRALQRLALECDVLEIVSAKGWVHRQPGSSGPTIPCLCSACGRAQRVPADEFGGPLNTLSADRRFRMTEVHLERLGLCARCRPASAPPVVGLREQQQCQASGQ
jgi:Fe2+ or Zn2+ uptake regulation protein